MSNGSMRQQLVIDASVCYTLVAPVEAHARLTGLIATQIEAGVQLYSPTLMAYELTSTLTKAVALGGMSEAHGQESLKQAMTIPIDLIAPDEALAQAAFAWTRRLRRAAAYDSFYLALAERLGCELWTVDRRLVNAASLPWVRDVG
jgi:predicted nucleic acid-binding protein